MRTISTLTACLLGLSGSVWGEVPSVSPEEARERLIQTAEEVSEQLGRGRLDQEILARQREIVRDLKRLLDSATIDSPPTALSGGDATEDEPSQGADGSNSTSPETGVEGRPANDRAGESTQVPDREKGAEEFSPLRRPDLADAVWGHLPPREREELIRTFNERYLPQYDGRVRRYFRDLGEQKDENDRSDD